MSVGRPKILDEKLMEMAWEYLNVWREREDTVPSIEGLAVYLCIARSTIYAWCSENEEFSDIVEQVSAVQARELINKSLKKDFDSRISQLLLSKHGFHEKSETTQTIQGRVDSTINVESLSSAVLEELADLRKARGLS